MILFSLIALYYLCGDLNFILKNEYNILCISHNLLYLANLLFKLYYSIHLVKLISLRNSEITHFCFLIILEK